MVISNSFDCIWFICSLDSFIQSVFYWICLFVLFDLLEFIVVPVVLFIFILILVYNHYYNCYCRLLIIMIMIMDINSKKLLSCNTYFLLLLLLLLVVIVVVVVVVVVEVLSTHCSPLWHGLLTSVLQKEISIRVLCLLLQAEPHRVRYSILYEWNRR